jgi:hypothetical protein
MQLLKNISATQMDKDLSLNETYIWDFGLNFFRMMERTRQQHPPHHFYARGLVDLETEK